MVLIRSAVDGLVKISAGLSKLPTLKVRRGSQADFLLQTKVLHISVPDSPKPSPRDNSNGCACLCMQVQQGNISEVCSHSNHSKSFWIPFICSVQFCFCSGERGVLAWCTMSSPHV